ncbi:MAG TPA: ABC transporter substrate-binding protein [Candidatus Limnocylindrales bacterium]|nr:ABC transporter substrate-binding protein [Candidatus Limnocylindrales bacterium]
MASPRLAPAPPRSPSAAPSQPHLTLPSGHDPQARHRGIRVATAGLLAVAIVALAVALGGPGLGGGAIRIGAVFPLTGDPDVVALAGQEKLGVRIAADFVNADGGIDGRPIALDVRDLPDAAAASSAIAALRADGVPLVIGAYASQLSIAASAAADQAGLVYWEAGAVADQLTGRGLPRVFRVGASGARLGTNSAQFSATELAPRLDLTPSDLRVTVVSANDAYASSVADAAVAESKALGLRLTGRVTYDLGLPRWSQVVSAVAASRPDVVILASHIPDGVAFVQALDAAHVTVPALIGSTMAECVPDFGNMLGDASLGIFGSDRPPSGFDPQALDPSARALYDRFAAAWAEQAGGPPTEEGLSGFTAAWALFHDVLPSAAAAGRLDAQDIAAAARAVDLPSGSLPNGAGLRFATDTAHLGQNLRAAAVMWQWQAASPASAAVSAWQPPSTGSGAWEGSDPTASGSATDGIAGGETAGSRTSGQVAGANATVQDVVVWPAAFAAGRIEMVPRP